MAILGSARTHMRFLFCGFVRARFAVALVFVVSEAIEGYLTFGPFGINSSSSLFLC